MPLRTLYSLILLSLLVACTSQKDQTDTTAPGPTYNQAAVVSAHPLASEAGKEMMQKGGNAWDAAVAVKFALAVVYPRAGNLGGGGFAVYRAADGSIGALDFREKAPAAASRDMYLDENKAVIDGLSLQGPLAAGVPGSVAGMVALHERYGSLTWQEVLAPALRLAQEGWTLSTEQAAKINAYQSLFLTNNPDTIFWAEKTWQAGDHVIVPHMAATIQRIQQEGFDGFYKGETARLIVEAMDSSGIITLEDLAGYEAIWRKPITSDYRGHKIITMPPPSSGGIALVQLLEGSEPLPIADWGLYDSRTIHYMTELERRVYADRASYLGDEDFYAVPREQLLDSSYLADRFAGITPGKATASAEIREGKATVIESYETTHFSIVDAQGNAVSITTTLNGNYGSKTFVTGAGFFLNNEMDDFSIKPGEPNQFGLIGAEANAIQPQKRMLSSMTPTIVERDGDLYLVLGSNGGSTIITQVYQAILNVVDHNMSLQHAINAPRLHHQWQPDHIIIEKDSLSASARKELEAMGHQLKAAGQFGKLNSIRRLPDGRLEAVADTLRGDDRAAGF